jgi:hypothetical protein
MANIKMDVRDLCWDIVEWLHFDPVVRSSERGKKIVLYCIVLVTVFER